MRSGRRVVVALTCLAVALPGCRQGSRFGGLGRRRGSVRYVDVGDPDRFPLTIYSSWSMAISTASVGRPYTTGVVVFNTHSATVQLIGARPIVRSPNLQVLGTGAAGSRRAIGEVLGTHGWPPADRKPEDEVRYRPMADVPVPRETDRHARGVNIVIGVRYTSGHEGWFDGLEVTYRVGPHVYTAQFPMAFALCDHQPCVAPKTGPPWGAPP